MKAIVLSDLKTGKELKLYKRSEYPLTEKQRAKSVGAKYIFHTGYKFSLAQYEKRILRSVLARAKVIGYTTYKKTVWGVWEE